MLAPCKFAAKSAIQKHENTDPSLKTVRDDNEKHKKWLELIARGKVPWSMIAEVGGGRNESAGFWPALSVAAKLLGGH
jgi:hypothetical protein